MSLLYPIVKNLNEVLSIRAQESPRPEAGWIRSTPDLNEVLSIRAQEFIAAMNRGVDHDHLNEVLSIRAQELGGLRPVDFLLGTSMKS